MRIGIRKSQSGRRVQVRRRKVFGRELALLCIPVVLAGGAISFFPKNIEVLAAALRDPGSILSQRSPGERSADALYNIKRDREAETDPTERALSHILPKERVLAVTRERPEPAPPGTPPQGDPGETIADAFAPGPVGAPGGDPGGPLTDGPPIFAPGSPLVPASTPTQEVPTPSVTSGVPEPATWAMNILGLFAVAGVMRWRARRHARGAAVPVA